MTSCMPGSIEGHRNTIYIDLEAAVKQTANHDDTARLETDSSHTTHM